MTLGELVSGLLLLSGLAWFWRGRGIRELALQHAWQRCQREGLQLLDANVAFDGWQLWRDGSGGRRLVRLYVFEFSVSGMERYRGSLRMRGRHLAGIELPPHRFATEAPGAVVLEAEAVRQHPGGC